MTDLLPHQDEFVNSEARFTVLMAGRRAGKTYALIEAVRREIRECRSAPCVMILGYEFLWRDLSDTLPDDEFRGEPVKSGSIFTWDPAVIDFMPITDIDPGKFWGRTFDMLCIDNMEMFIDSHETFNEIITRVLMANPRAKIRITLDPNTHIPEWMLEFIERDDVHLVNAFDQYNPSV